MDILTIDYIDVGHLELWLIVLIIKTKKIKWLGRPFQIKYYT